MENIHLLVLTSISINLNQCTWITIALEKLSRLVIDILVIAYLDIVNLSSKHFIYEKLRLKLSKNLDRGKHILNA